MQKSAKAAMPTQREGTQQRRRRGFSGGLHATTAHQMSRNSSSDTPASDPETSLPRSPRSRGF
jgi:hypothetical protein